MARRFGSTRWRLPGRKTRLTRVAQLDVIIDEVAKLWGAHNIKDIQQRYKIGELVLKVQSSAAWGSAGVLRMAERLHIQPSNLYFHSKVVKTWSWEQVQKIMKDAKVAVTWSALSQLSYERDAKLRNKMLKQLMETRVTVASLKRMAHPERRGRYSRGLLSESELVEAMKTMKPAAIANALESLIKLAPSRAHRLMIISALAQLVEALDPNKEPVNTAQPLQQSTQSAPAAPA